MTVTFVLVVSDGTTLRTLHPAGLGPERSALVADIIAGHLADAAPTAPVRRPPGVESLFTQREIATAQGFTGDVCPSCQSLTMVRAGTCLTCRSCGATTGCS